MYVRKYIYDKIYTFLYRIPNVPYNVNEISFRYTHILQMYTIVGLLSMYLGV
jgi:hypothetical protein